MFRGVFTYFAACRRYGFTLPCSVQRFFFRLERVTLLGTVPLSLVFCVPSISEDYTLPLPPSPAITLIQNVHSVHTCVP